MNDPVTNDGLPSQPSIVDGRFNLVGRLREALQNSAIRASAWTFGSYGVSQVLRLGSNILLTHLLSTDEHGSSGIIGLMFIVNTVLQGLQMLSDLGIAPSIIQNPRGEETRFLRTAWTLQILRGALLWVVAGLIAWPLSLYLDQPLLALVLPLITLTIFIEGFSSMNLAVYNRRLQIAPMVMLELGAYAFSLCVMITWAWFSPTIWAPVAGGIAYSTVYMIASHGFRGVRMAFQLDRGVAGQVLHFGKWLFLSSILAFLAGQLDRLILMSFMTTEQLGVYSVAWAMAMAMVQVLAVLARKVLFPLYARTAEANFDDLRRQTRRVRLVLLSVSLPPMWLLIFIAPELMDFLYPEEYHEAGWMLQVLGIGGIFACILTPVDCVLMATGDTFRHMLMQFSRSVLVMICMTTGYAIAGVNGLIYGFAASTALYYPFLVLLIRRYRVWLPGLDLGAAAVSAAVVGAGLYLRSILL